MEQNSTTLILDDRLLIEELLVGLDAIGSLHTTSYWYYRACRAAVVGGGGHLSGPFAQLDEPEQRAAIRTLLVLRDDIGLPDPRTTVPAMAELSERHPRLNLLNLEAAAAALVLGGEILLSAQATRGVLPNVLETEGVTWQSFEFRR